MVYHAQLLKVYFCVLTIMMRSPGSPSMCGSPEQWQRMRKEFEDSEKQREERKKRDGRIGKKFTFSDKGVLVAVPHSRLNLHLQNLLLQNKPVSVT